MTGEKNSLLVSRIDGQMYQMLADEKNLYLVWLGSVRRGLVRRGLNDAGEFVHGPRAERISKAEIEIVHIRAGESQTQISMNTADGERTWYMNICIPEEAVRAIFGGLNLFLEGIPGTDAGLSEGLAEGDEAAFEKMDIPPIPSGELLLNIAVGTLAVLFSVLWWTKQSALMAWANLLFFPLTMVLLARCEGTRYGRFGLSRLLWTLPGIALTLMNVRLNLPEPGQILLPAACIAVLIALIYTLLCRGRRRIRKIAAVLVICLLTYAPGAALSVNMLGGERIRMSRVTPRIVRSDWVEAPLDGRQQRFYVHPEVCRKLSVNAPCELQLHKGLLGIEYWTVAPQARPDEV